ncbi:hypothetical protein AGMMS50230_22870 [Spirochaetia bacterium]|nr:hypothetical protein AGMMS50230_22870 [Spirochaetia bacterium]
MKKKVQFLRGAVFTAILFAAVLSCGGGGGDGGSPNLLGGGIIYAIGDTGPGGGIIFYYDAAGFIVNAPSLGYNNKTCYYLEAAPADLGAPLEWATESKKGAYINAKGTAIGTGAANTGAILAGDPDALAAKACDEYTNGGKADDWFLPTTSELEKLWGNRSYVDNFTVAKRWSSYQASSPADAAASVQQFSISADPKRTPLLVRPIRAF